MMYTPLIVAATYSNTLKTALVLATFLLWCFCIQWGDRDAEKVKTIRERWNILCLMIGVLGLCAWFLIPWKGWPMFLAGWAVYIFIVGSGLMLYVSHRNKRVGPKFRVLTAEHLSSLMTRQSEDQLDRSQHEYRVRLIGQDRKTVELPNDIEEAEQFSSTQELFYDALWRRANEIDLAVSSDKMKLNYRIDGVSAERRDFLTPQQGQQAITFIKKIAGLDVQERRRPQRGEIKASLLGDSSDAAPIEVRSSGTTASERMFLRIYSADTYRTLDELGLHPQRLEQLKKVINLTEGIVIVCGPPESGITSTLYGIVRSHDAYILNIHSLEKRRLYEVDNITQHNFDPSKQQELSYAKQLQSIMRREPDVVLVGELDDKETANVMIKSAGQDKKMYAGMTAADSFDALDTFLGWVKDKKIAANQLQAIMSQRLIRKLCPICREAYKPDKALLRKANLPVEKIEHFYRPPTQKTFDKQGREIVCPTCQGSGYAGRFGAFELLTIDDSIRAMIKSGANTTQIKAQARKNKMYYLQEEGLLKTMDGTTSINEILRGLKDNASRQ